MNRAKTRALSPYIIVLMAWGATQYWCIDIVGKSTHNWPSIGLLCRYAIDSTFRPIDKKNCLKTHQYSRQTAIVYKTDGICDQERSYIAKRKERVAQALKPLVGQDIPISAVPTIGILGSGGGYRALLWMLGAFVGLEKIGLLDAITYASGLSGSGWFLANYMQRNCCLAELKKILVQNIGTNHSIFSPTAQEKQFIFNTLLPEKKALYGAHTSSVVDLYGALLVNHLFADLGDKRFEMMLSHQANNLVNGEVVFPIYTAASRSKCGFDWYEFTPYQVRSLEYKIAIPTWAYGRSFYQGLSTNYVPEQYLSSLLGTFGSAFSVSLQRGWHEYLKSINVLAKSDMSSWQRFFDTYIVQNKGDIVPFKGAIVPNFMYGISDSKEKYLHLVDPNTESGMLNFSYPPLTPVFGGRSLDVIIFLDASYHIVGANNLKKIETYSHSHGIKFPVIDYTGIESRSISIFIDKQDPTVPIVIYIPRIIDLSIQYSEDIVPELREKIALLDLEKEIENGSYRTLNFAYTPEKVEMLCVISEFALYANKQKIKQAFIEAVARKSSSLNLLSGTQ